MASARLRMPCNVASTIWICKIFHGLQKNYSKLYRVYHQVVRTIWTVHDEIFLILCNSRMQALSTRTRFRRCNQLPSNVQVRLLSLTDTLTTVGSSSLRNSESGSKILMPSEWINWPTAQCRPINRETLDRTSSKDKTVARKLPDNQAHGSSMINRRRWRWTVSSESEVFGYLAESK